MSYVVTLLLLLHRLSSLSAVLSDISSDRAALVKLHDALGGRTLLWNLSDSPCKWIGVYCAKGRVVMLRLPGMSLTGELPLGLGNLTEMTTLSLRFNSLSGPIPGDLSKLQSLSRLYLQGNSFTGEVPDFMFSLRNLIHLNLAQNKFSGTISSSFNNLTKLVILQLEENQFNGVIPELNLPLLATVNFSHNNLNGSIPERLSNKPSSAFEGNDLCGKPLPPCNNTTLILHGSSKNGLSGGVIAAIVVGGVVALMLVVMILVFLLRRKKPSMETQTVGSKHLESTNSGDKAVTRDSGTSHSKDGRNSGSKDLMFVANQGRLFDLEELLRASAEVLGKGTYGTTYKASIGGGNVVAVKRLKDVNVSNVEFKENIEALGMLNHDNLVPFIAYYYGRDEKLLLSEYIPAGSLSLLLHGHAGGSRAPLNWVTRITIALGAARGLDYIHSQSPSLSHGNIKSSNILLTQSSEARVSDYGIAHLSSPSSASSRLDGYHAPEVTDTRSISHKADVFSFGVLLLEILTGKSPLHSTFSGEGLDLARWVQSIVKDEWTDEVFDLELLRYQAVEEEMIQLLQLGVDCVSQYPEGRPPMDAVRRRIEELHQNTLRKSGWDQDVAVQ